MPSLPADEQPGARVVVLSHDTWTRHLGADPAIVGQAIVVSGAPHVVAGVAPAGFSFPVDQRPTELWTTLAHDASAGTRTPVTEQRGARMLDTIARLAPGVSIQQASAEIDGIAGSLTRQFPDQNANVEHADVRSAIDRILGPMRAGVLMLWGTVGLVLLIACANVSNLLVARTADREREFDVRLALGGSRGRIVRQLVIENLLLGACGSVAGVVVAYAGLRVMLPLADGLPRIGEVDIDVRVLIFAALVAVATTLLVTLAPAIRLLRAGRTRPMQTTARTVAEGRHRLRGAIVIAQSRGEPRPAQRRDVAGVRPSPAAQPGAWLRSTRADRVQRVVAGAIRCGQARAVLLAAGRESRRHRGRWPGRGGDAAAADRSRDRDLLHDRGPSCTVERQTDIGHGHRLAGIFLDDWHAAVERAGLHRVSTTIATRVC